MAAEGDDAHIYRNYSKPPAARCVSNPVNVTSSKNPLTRCQPNQSNKYTSSLSSKYYVQPRSRANSTSSVQQQQRSRANSTSSSTANTKHNFTTNTSKYGNDTADHTRPESSRLRRRPVTRHMNRPVQMSPLAKPLGASSVASSDCETMSTLSSLSSSSKTNKPNIGIITSQVSLFLYPSISFRGFSFYW